MRFAILSPIYPYRGGIAQFSGRLYQELVEEGHEVKAFNFKRLYPDILFPGKTQYVEEGESVEAIASERVLDSVNPLSYINTTKAIRAYAPDVLIISYWMSFFVPGYAHVANRMRKHCKVIALIHNAIPHEPHFFDKPFTRYFLKGSHGYVTLCEAVAGDLLRLKPDAEYRVIQHPLYSHFGQKTGREEAERRLGLQPGKKNILFFGLIREYKGLDILIDAFKGLGEGYQLIIAGEPYGSFEPYRKQIEESGCQDRIRTFLYYVRDSQVKVFFSAADVTVLPYRSATQSGISSVSYHFEVPMIVTDVGGMKETIGDRGTGILADSIGPEAIRRAVQHFFSDPQIAANCITEIRKEKERLSWGAFCRELIDFSCQLNNTIRK